jgi:hypothetical protein
LRVLGVDRVAVDAHLSFKPWNRSSFKICEAVEVKRALKDARAWVSVPVTLAILAYVWWEKGFASAEMASWVQAVGALLAIAIAICLARSTAKREEAIRAQASAEAADLRLEGRTAQVKAACLVAESVCDSLITGYGVLEKRLKSRDYERALPIFAVKRGAEAVSRIPAHEIPYTVVGRELMTLATFADQYLQLASDIRSARRQADGALGDDESHRTLQSRRAVLAVKEVFGHFRATYDGRAVLPITMNDIQ